MNKIVRNKMKHFLHIFESPKPIDLLGGVSEAGALSSTLEQHSIEHDLSIVVDRNCLKEWVAQIVDQIQEEDYRPILHFSCHGSEKGINLTSQENLSWDELRNCLEPIIEATDQNILLCFSSCFGRAAHNMHSKLEGEFEYIVGPVDEIDWDAALVAYSSFYHNFITRACEFSKSIAYMNAAIGVDELAFSGISAAQISAIKLDSYTSVIKEKVEKLAKTTEDAYQE